LTLHIQGRFYSSKMLPKGKFVDSWENVTEASAPCTCPSTNKLGVSEKHVVLNGVPLRRGGGGLSYDQLASFQTRAFRVGDCFQVRESRLQPENPPAPGGHTPSLRVSWGRARLDSAGYKAPGTFRLCARFCSKVETLPSPSDSLRRSCDIIGLLIVDRECFAIHPIYDTGASTSVRNPHSRTEGTCESWSPTTTA